MISYLIPCLKKKRQSKLNINKIHAPKVYVLFVQLIFKMLHISSFFHYLKLTVREKLIPEINVESLLVHEKVEILYLKQFVSF